MTCQAHTVSFDWDEWWLSLSREKERYEVAACYTSPPGAPWPSDPTAQSAGQWVAETLAPVCGETKPLGTTPANAQRGHCAFCNITVITLRDSGTIVGGQNNKNVFEIIIRRDILTFKDLKRLWYFAVSHRWKNLQTLTLTFGESVTYSGLVIWSLGSWTCFAASTGTRMDGLARRSSSIMFLPLVRLSYL